MIEIAVKINGKNLEGGIRSNKATIEEVAISIAELESFLDTQKEVFKKITNFKEEEFKR